MRQPEELYELKADAPDVSGAAFLVNLEEFMDAGSAGRQLTEHLLDSLEHETLASFDTDRLLDYRSRRPLMTFDKTRWESYDDPRLEVHVLRDPAGKPFTLLTGPEPDHEWELFVAAARTVATRLKLGTMITYFGVPMGIPHTRPLGVMTHATRPGLVTSRVPSPGKLQVPASAASLMELRFGQAGRDALDLPADTLKDAADRTNVLINQQVAESTEVADLVHGLEVQWDAATTADGNLLAEGEEMPTADELAAQFEQFLAEQQRGED